MKNLGREILVTLLLAIIIFALVQTAFRSFRVEGASMEPNIHDGQYLLVNKIVYYFRQPQRGEVIVFHPSASPHTNYVKRVIALPGERVKAVNGKVYINRGNGWELLDEPYLKTNAVYSFEWLRPIPQDHYFVLGDNRNHSSDSRLWGPISRETIIGKAWFRYWPLKEWGLIPSYSPLPD
jgi:signal peptidase I